MLQLMNSVGTSCYGDIPAPMTLTHEFESERTTPNCCTSERAIHKGIAFASLDFAIFPRSKNNRRPLLPEKKAVNNKRFSQYVDPKMRGKL